MSKKRAHKTLPLEEKLTILDELSLKMHRQLAHLYIVNTHYNDIHYFNNPNISLIRPPSGPKLFGLVRVYCILILMVNCNIFKCMAKEGAKWRVHTLFLNNFIKKLFHIIANGIVTIFLSLKTPKSGIEVNQGSWDIKIKTIFHVRHLEGAK